MSPNHKALLNRLLHLKSDSIDYVHDGNVFRETLYTLYRYQQHGTHRPEKEIIVSQKAYDKFVKSGLSRKDLCAEHKLPVKVIYNMFIESDITTVEEADQWFAEHHTITHILLDEDQVLTQLGLRCELPNGGCRYEAGGIKIAMQKINRKDLVQE